MPKRARGDPIEYVRNVRLRALRQFWDWFHQLLRPRRLHFSRGSRVWMEDRRLSVLADWVLARYYPDHKQEYWRPRHTSEYFMRNLFIQHPLLEL